MEKVFTSETKKLGSLKVGSSTARLMQFIILVLSLNFTAACVVTPDGTYATIDGGAAVDVDYTPQILDANNSYVTVRIGPRFYASDAYLLAYNHCLNLGLYAYEVSPWSHSASVMRDLRYDCRPTYIAPPMVYHIDRGNRYRYDYFNNYYFRHHRPNHHFRPPSSGWWGRNHYNPTYPQPAQVYQGPGYTHDGRVTTPSSPRTYNPVKDRYVPRTNVYTPAPSNPKPGWWGQGSGSNVNTAPTNNVSPRTSPRPRYGSGNTLYNSSPRTNPSAPSVESPRPSVTPSKPSFWGQPKSGGGSHVTPPSRGSYSKYSSSGSTPSRSANSRTEERESSKNENSSPFNKSSKPSWMR